ncbi:MAG: phenylalanine--tRNA ligase subunit alpha [Candidatus Zambryskibacteria bacterium RIFCSPHIGHO2_01_FULL_43_25]|uniref:phenylalanine--tRNA ligase n=1 Tax=Candidatus Zambryskibacteria bacterium RIFCSPLOWO2_01_FULL_45_21 TaxID=1802761 RepID=A0A1G2U402_9BACT|nr:MAG: phenylalanine--tRNA ligase subunit alpha [Candidatus Zambryskibacteria bacterium RIFCSPHIGHO2_01_FULL_43_25]OHB00404.1 MAG: phenylalanine--tRNA ligase subunit alpha [Candidatus Zambryskibacteria bacterium RIFCSPHIGHO2_12_FULL_44_12b]OHB04199.1 MAG: phenylalanine--tRNA ligase subunit alpha [Candidatus Zambryskibacteria bacterium RIFCSPLOWO2_01_FULL_45_21]
MKEYEADTYGHLHPISHIIRQTAYIFSQIGFSTVSGPEIETEYYNFDALNIPAHHPARDMWDTFWLKQTNNQQSAADDGLAGGKDSKSSVVGSKLLRTHTSPVQVRFAEKNKPPIRIIVPGKTFRHEATDATHEAQFFQLEGLYIDTDVSLANLKFVLEFYLEKLFGSKTDIRFRPSFFPFVEPGVEIDMSCFKCGGSGCPTCKQSGWIEIMGAGMVHPKVLSNMGIHPKRFSGFAFGGGIDRLAMLKFGIGDIRSLYTGDLRLINQF